MSLALAPVKVVKVVDPRTAVNQARQFAFIASGVQNTFYQNPSTQYSSSAIQWSFIAPSPQTLLDKKMYAQMDMNLTFSGADLSAPLISLGSDDALRHLPLQNCCEVSQIQINSMATSINSRDVLETLLRYDSSFEIQNKELSIFPSMQDQYQDYDDWNTYGLARNPMAFAGENSTQETRGSSVFYTVTSNTNTSAVIRCRWVEPLLIPPLQAGRGDSNAFASVQNVNINLTLSDLSRMWSHNGNTGGAGRAITIDSVAFASAPVLLTNAISTNDVQDPVSTSKIYQYDYAEIQRFPTNIGSMTTGQVLTLSTQNIQMSRVPNRVWIVAKQRNLDQTFNTSDVFAYISNIQILYNNKNGLLSTMAPSQIYQMCVRNGMNLNWGQFAFFVGSPICVQWGYDVQLDPTVAPGMSYNSNFQVQCTVTNLSASTINYDLYIIPEFKGVYNIQGVSANAQLGVLSMQDVLDAGKNPLLEYTADQRTALLGGNIFSDIGSTFKRGFDYLAPHALNALKTYGPAIAKRGLQYALTGTGSSGLVGGKRRKSKKGRGLSGSALPSGKISREQLKARLEKAVNSDDSGSDSDE